MKSIRIYIVILIITILSGCQKTQTLTGLWIVKSVKMGNEEMTPNARWMRFNPDFTQESGNGWLQHSAGNWTYSSEHSELEISNTNGLADPYGPFKVKLRDGQMTWKRLEEGQPIEVTLVKKEELPKTNGDQILGLWELVKTTGTSPHTSDLVDEMDYLFFRWDRKYVVGTKKRKAYGVYNVHGHKAELELFPYNKDLNKSRWMIYYKGDRLILSMMNSDSIVSYRFKRIDHFPE